MINAELLKNHYLKFDFPLTEEFLTFLKQRQWEKLDALVGTMCQKEGELFQFLQDFHPFTSIEHIVALRSAPQDEDGIWHDDGSRYIAFTLSLNENPESISGGELLLREKGSQVYQIIPPPPLGTLLIFPTGQYGLEHKVCGVTAGERKTIAGWCS